MACPNCGAPTLTLPCTFCGRGEYEVQQRIAAEWDSPRYFFRRGQLISGPFSARQIVQACATAQQTDEVRDGAGPWVPLYASQFAQHLPPRRSSMLWVWLVLGFVVLAMGGLTCSMCAIM